MLHKLTTYLTLPYLTLHTVLSLSLGLPTDLTYFTRHLQLTINNQLASNATRNTLLTLPYISQYRFSNRE